MNIDTHNSRKRTVRKRGDSGRDHAHLGSIYMYVGGWAHSRQAVLGGNHVVLFQEHAAGADG